MTRFAAIWPLLISLALFFALPAQAQQITLDMGNGAGGGGSLTQRSVQLLALITLL